MKLFNYWYLILVLLLSLGSHSVAQNKATIDIKDDEKLIKFTTDRFTLPNLHVTPDKENIIFDVLGDIYQVPIEGGKAEILLQDNNWKRAGKLSPDGKTLAYVSDEAGEFQVWTYDIKTKNKQSYPIKESLHYPLVAYWDIKGNLLIPNDDGLISYDVVAGTEEMLRPAKEEERSIMHSVNRKMTINSSGTHAYFQFDNMLWIYDLKKQIDQYIGEFKVRRKKTLVHASPNGQNIIYFSNSSETSNKIKLRYLNLKTNTIKSLYETDDLGFSTTLDFSFDFINDHTIVINKEGEIVHMDIETGAYKSIPIEVNLEKIIKKPLRRDPQYVRDSIITASVLRNPVTKAEMDCIYFGAFGKLHSYAKSTEVITELYPDKDRFEGSPSLSPNGKYLTYTTWNDWEMGHVYVRELNTNKEHQLTKTPGRYINPTWSPDGTEILFVADETENKMGIAYQKPGHPSFNHMLDIYKINLLEKELDGSINSLEIIKRITPPSKRPKRYYPIPVYHTNGKSFYITTRNKEKNLPVLIEIDLTSKEVIHEKLIPFHIDEVLIAPNAQSIAFIYDEQVWIDTYPYSTKLEFLSGSEFIQSKYYYKGGYVNNILLPNAESIYEVAPSYLSWQDEHILMWGSADEVYKYDVRSGKTEKIANIKVQRPRAIPKGNYALTNTKIITINKQDQIIKHGTILVKDNRIRAVGSTDQIVIPDNYKIYNLEGKTIIPGLIDVHAHYHSAPYEFQIQQNYNYVGNLAYGVTCIYDPSVNVLEYKERAQMVETGQIIGPRVFASGEIIMENPKNSRFNKIENKFDSDRILLSTIKMNVHGPIKEYDIYNKMRRELLHNASKIYGIGITAHQGGYIQALSRIINGYTAIEHEIGSFLLQKDVTTLLGVSKVNYTPTYMVRPGIRDIYTDQTRKDERKLLNLNGKLGFNNYYGHIHSRQTDEKKDYIYEWSNSAALFHSRASETLKKIIDSGGKVSVGGHGNPLPGIGTHWELWFMTKGMSNYQALQAATINGAEKLDLQEEIGSIEEGKLADMVVLNSDPLESIFNTTDILYTIQNGNIYEAETMKQIYPIEKELAPWGWDSPIVLESMESIYKRE